MTKEEFQTFCARCNAAWPDQHWIVKDAGTGYKMSCIGVGSLCVSYNTALSEVEWLGP
jgi:hypothetical protein